ncbi:MAG: DIP1984 family protein [Bacteroidota bacterium]
MKLAEALVTRAHSQRRLAQLKQRLMQSAQVQEGEQPAEPPHELLEEYEVVAIELERLIRQINQTNMQTTLDSGETLTEVLAARDVLRMRMLLYRDLAESATVSHERYSRSEVKLVSTVNVRSIRKQADALSKAYRDLDARIQAVNWQTELRT